MKKANDKTNWSLPELLDSLNTQVEQDLKTARRVMGHAVDKGDCTEEIWISLLQNYLPKRYESRKAHVVDSRGNFSDQIDLVIHDRQYSPLIFKFEGKSVIPAESVYAVFETKQDMTDANIKYAQNKVTSVRKLYRTSLDVPTVDGVKTKKELHDIIGGILTLSCGWKPPFGNTMGKSLEGEMAEGRLDIGCVAESGYFTFDNKGSYTLSATAKPVTAFLLELIARLQAIGTVPMIDVRSYAAKLS
ncbi:MAG: hypothetical protein IH886_03325 [Nitrospinae bacterium]|nr:hypothetical protein [Nitrospinota bacterium]